MTSSQTGKLVDQLGILLDAMETSTNDKHLTLALGRFTRAIGLKHFGFVCTDGDRVITVTDLPTSWEERYHAERYSGVDPVVSRARRSHGPFEWSLPKLENLPRASKAFCDEIEGIGVVAGVTVPAQVGFGRTAMLSFFTDDPAPPAFCPSALQSAVSAVAYAHRHVNDSHHFRQAYRSILTSRETACVIWTSHGKRKSEIAHMYGLSEKTVRFHLDNAKIKLKASNVTHLVRRAFEAGLIPPP